MHKRFALIAATLLQPTLSVAETHDNFQHLGEINKALIVMLAEEGLVPAGLAADITAGIGRVIAEQAEDGAARSSNYLDFEARLVEVAGHDASRLHTGRSRQDIGSTFRRKALREALLDTDESLLGAWQALLELAAKHIDTIIPAYTHGVQAQPTTLAHYLLAFSAAFERDARRLEEAYARLNLSPLDAVRLLATAVVGSAHTVTLNAHNTNSEMNDYRPGAQAQDAANKAQAMDPATMVRERKGLGGPQEAEVLRMLVRHNDLLASWRAWLDASRSHLQHSTAALEQAFAELEQ